MGIDIHIIIQTKTNGIWTSNTDELIGWRHYDLFSALAGLPLRDLRGDITPI